MFLLTFIHYFFAFPLALLLLIDTPYDLFLFFYLMFCSRTNHDNGCYKKGPYCSPCSDFDNDNDTDNRNISQTHCDMSMSGLFFWGVPGQDMTVLDSRLYTWQEDLRWFGWFGVY